MLCDPLSDAGGDSKDTLAPYVEWMLLMRCDVKVRSVDRAQVF